MCCSVNGRSQAGLRLSGRQCQSRSSLSCGAKTFLRHLRAQDRRCALFLGRCQAPGAIGGKLCLKGGARLCLGQGGHTAAQQFFRPRRCIDAVAIILKRCLACSLGAHDGGLALPIGFCDGERASGLDIQLARLVAILLALLGDSVRHHFTF